MTAKLRRVRIGVETEAAARAFSGSIQRAIQMPLFDALAQAGGGARPIDVYDAVAQDLGVDQAVLSETRTCGDGQSYKVFQQQVRWARQTAVADGLIAGGRGTWELTDRGYDKLGRVKRGVTILIYSTDDGIALWAHAEDAAQHIEAGLVQLVLTSPPYPVVKRAYGRFSVPEWLDWMRRLMAIWKGLIRSDGTIAVNLMDVFVSGTPTLSPYIERFTLAAVDDVGLHLAGRMAWHSPTKLGNIQWAVKEKVAPRNQLEHILLFSPSPRPAWDASRMDRPARSNRRPEKRQTARPSGMDINESAFRPGGAPLPVNLIVAGGVSGNDAYSRRCRAAGLQPHPARFPDALPRQIIQLATDVGDVVYDPMAGSNKTGAVAAELGRRWIASEPMRQYLNGSALRFERRGDLHVYDVVGDELDGQ